MRSLFIAVAALLFGGADIAQADLRFEAQVGDGGTFLVVTGEFEYSDDLAQFETLVAVHHPAFVTFISPGGNIFKALELGRIIRASGLATVQLRALECSSACAFAFFGGVVRRAEPGSIGMHKASISNTTSMTVEDAVSSVQTMTANLSAYMSEMGVDPSLLQLALQYEANDIRYLSSSEMERYRVTWQGEARLLTSAVPTAPPADYCVTEGAPNDPLNLRTGPNTTFAVVATLPFASCGIQVTGQCRGGWCPVEVGHTSGWVSGSYITKMGQEEYCVYGLTADDTLNVRTGPGIGFDVVGKWAPDQCGLFRLPFDSQDGWALVRGQEVGGWASLRYLRSR